MTKPISQRVVVPVANRNDAVSIATALGPYLKDTDCSVIVVHVIERISEAPNKAPIEKREQRAEDIFGIITESFDTTGISVETDLHYGTDIVSSILDAAHDSNASSVIFTPRGGSRWRKLLTGDVTHNVVTNGDLPIQIIPDRDQQQADTAASQPNKQIADR